MDAGTGSLHGAFRLGGDGLSRWRESLSTVRGRLRLPAILTAGEVVEARGPEATLVLCGDRLLDPAAGKEIGRASCRERVLDHV